MFTPTIVFDFDGVIHSYTSKWKGDTVIPDPPVPGIKEVIESLQARGYDVIIVSSRARSQDGRYAIHEWLKKYDIPITKVMYEKPAALVYVDDRAICFDGNADDLYEKIVNFKTWSEKEKEKNGMD